MREKALRDTHWSEWVNVLQINPDAASREDVARLATELFEAEAREAELVEALEAILNESAKELSPCTNRIYRIAFKVLSQKGEIQ